MSLKYDPEIDHALKPVLEALEQMQSVGAGPFHTQAELVVKAGMPELEKNTIVLAEAADTFFGKSLVQYTEAVQKMWNNQRQMKEALGIED